MADNERMSRPGQQRTADASTSEESRRAAEQRREQRKERLSEDKSRLQKEQAERNQAAVEKGQAGAQAQPTPTQIENDLAKLGHPLPDKEDDRSGPNMVPRMVQAEEEQPGSGYANRSMGSSAPGGGGSSPTSLGGGGRRESPSTPGEKKE